MESASAATGLHREEITGSVLQVEYTSGQGWHVLVLKPRSGAPFRACGPFARPVAGEEIRLLGTWTELPGPGRLFVFSTVTGNAGGRGAGGASGLINHLVDALGISTSDAGNIVAHFGETTLAVLDHHADRLREVAGLSEGAAKQILSRWRRVRASDRIAQGFRDHGLSTAVLAQLATRLGSDPTGALQAHPYLPYLYFPEAVTFGAIEKFARTAGLPADGQPRIEAGIIHVLHRHGLQGQTYLERTVAIGRVARALGLQAGRVETELAAAVAALSERGLVHVVGSRLHLASLYAAETRMVDRVHVLGDAPLELPIVLSPERLARLFADTTDLALGPADAARLAEALRHPLICLSGLPAHRTHALVTGLVKTVQLLHGDVAICAPTEATVSLFSQTPGNGEQLVPIAAFGGSGTDTAPRYHSHRPLPVDTLIVVDADRLTVVEMSRVFDAVRTGTRIVLLGDLGRLPPIGPGQPFRDLLVAPGVVHLPLEPQTWADGATVALATAAGALLARSSAPPSTVGFGRSALECFYLRPAELRATLEMFCRQVAPALGYDLAKDVLIVNPARKALDNAPSLEDINRLAQAARTPHGKRMPLPREKDLSYGQGDPVIVRRPRLDHGLVAGERGHITRINADKSIGSLRFGERQLDVPFSFFGDLTLGYAATGHLASSLSVACSVVVLLNAHRPLLNRQWLSTAVNCARERCVVFAEQAALDLALGTESNEVRDVYLPELLQAQRHADRQ